MTTIATFAAMVLFTLACPVVVAEPSWSAARALMMLIALQAIGLLVSLVFTSIERRHLMTWSIFAPKLTFELVGVLFMTILTLLFA